MIICVACVRVCHTLGYCNSGGCTTSQFAGETFLYWMLVNAHLTLWLNLIWTRKWSTAASWT